MGNILRFAAARVFPAFIGFVAIVVYTRLLSPAEFGTYSLALAGINVASCALFHWLGLSVVRFGINGMPNRPEYLASILFLYALTCVASVLVFGAIALATGAVPSRVALLCATIVVVDSWFVLNQRLAIALVQPGRLAIMSTIKSLVGVIAGGAAAAAGHGGEGVLVGLLVGTLCAVAFPAQVAAWADMGVRGASRPFVGEIVRYGGPLGITVALGYALTAVDRALLARMFSVQSTGEYAAGYDLASAAVVLTMTSVNVAMFPKLLEIAEQGDAMATHRYRKRTLDLLMFVSLPAVAILISLAGNISSTLLGPAFAGAAASTLPWIAIGALFGGLRSYHFDLVFHLDRDTGTILLIVTLTLFVNVAANCALIPSLGIAGAVASSVGSQFVGVALSAWLGRRRSHERVMPGAESIKCLVAAGIAAAAVWPFAGARGFAPLLAQVALVGIVYAAGLVAMRSHLALEVIARLEASWERARRRPVHRDA